MDHKGKSLICIFVGFVIAVLFCIPFIIDSKNIRQAPGGYFAYIEDTDAWHRVDMSVKYTKASGFVPDVTAEKEIE